MQCTYIKTSSDSLKQLRECVWKFAALICLKNGELYRVIESHILLLFARAATLLPTTPPSLLLTDSELKDKCSKNQTPMIWGMLINLALGVEVEIMIACSKCTNHCTVI